MSNNHTSTAEMTRTCEQVCRCATVLGAKLHEDRNAAGLYLFTFRVGGESVAGEANADRLTALHSACVRALDAIGL